MPTYIFSKYAYAPHITISSTPTQCHYDIPVWCAPNRSEIKKQAERLSQHVSTEELHVRFPWLSTVLWQDLLWQVNGSENRSISFYQFDNLFWSRVGSSEFPGATAASTWHPQLFFAAFILGRIGTYLDDDGWRWHDKTFPVTLQQNWVTVFFLMLWAIATHFEMCWAKYWVAAWLTLDSLKLRLRSWNMTLDFGPPDVALQDLHISQRTW